MSIATTKKTAPATPMASPTDHRHRITIERYYRLMNSGVYKEKEPIYLWKGQLVDKMTKNPPHVYSLTKLAALMVRSLPEGWHSRQEQPVELPDDSVPEPDLTVVRGTPEAYSQHHPTPRDVAIVIEVADSSLAEDQGDVLETYAAHQIPVYWIVNIPGQRIEVYSQPTGPVQRPFYRHSDFYGPPDEVPVVIDGRVVARLRGSRDSPLSFS